MNANIIYLSIILSVFVLYGCKNNSMSTNNTETSGLWNFKAEKSYKQGAKINITATYKGDNSTNLYNPMILVIEKKQADQNWVQMRTLYCPCNESCPAPPEQMSIAQNESKTFSWNQQEEWCERQADNTKKNISQQVEKGTYRLVMQYGMDNVQISQAFYIFTIE